MQFAGSVTNDSPARFVPDDAPEERLRLTTIPMQAAQTPEAAEADLAPYQGMRIDFQGQTSDDA
jgi:hypothetical protein